MGLNSRHIIDFSQLHKADLDLVGKKAYQMGELKQLGIPIPDGFVITTSFFKDFLQETGLNAKIKKIEELMHPAIEESMEKLFEPIRKEIMQTHLPQNLSNELQRFYRKLAGVFKDPLLNIYSSAKENKSIAFYDIKGDANLILKIKTLLTHYLDQPFSVIVQKAFKSKDKRSVVTNAASTSNQNLLDLVKKIQNYFYFPKDLEYVIEKGKIYITDVKPFTGAINERQENIQQAQKLHKILIKGISLNPGIVTGRVKLINNQNFDIAKNSEIIVAKSLNKSSYSKIRKAKAVVIDTSLQTSIDRLLYRRIIKAPTIIGTENATKLFQNGNIITVNGVTGEVYSGGFI